MILIAVYGTAVFTHGLLHSRPRNIREEGEREEKRGTKKSGAGKWYFDECFTTMMCHYCHYIFLALFVDPASLQVCGLHQTMGSPPGSTDGTARPD